jgi:hypothetical protein
MGGVAARLRSCAHRTASGGHVCSNLGPAASSANVRQFRGRPSVPAVTAVVKKTPAIRCGEHVCGGGLDVLEGSHLTCSSLIQNTAPFKQLRGRMCDRVHVWDRANTHLPLRFTSVHVLRRDCVHPSHATLAHYARAQMHVHRTTSGVTNYAVLAILLRHC